MASAEVSMRASIASGMGEHPSRQLFVDEQSGAQLRERAGQQP